MLGLNVTACSNVSGGGTGPYNPGTSLESKVAGTYSDGNVSFVFNSNKSGEKISSPSPSLRTISNAPFTWAVISTSGSVFYATITQNGENTSATFDTSKSPNTVTISGESGTFQKNGGGGNRDFTTFTVDPVDVNINEEEDLTINITPSDGVIYEARSNDTNTATVTVNGGTVTVTGLAAGATTVSVTATKEGYNNKTVTVPVTVTNPALPNFNSFTISDVSMYMGDSKNLSITIDPSDGVTYTAVSGDDSVATVSVNGSNVAVTGTKDGTTTVSVTAKKDGYNSMTVTADVTVTLKNFNSLTVSPESVEVKSGESTTLTVSSDPSGEGVTYTAVPVDASKAEVTVSGSTVTVKGKGAGSTTVSVTAKKDGYNDMTVTADVTVKPVDFKSFSIAPTSVGLEKSKNLTINITPSDGVTYTAVSNDTSKVEVTGGSTVTVKGMSPGWTKVKVTAKKAGYNDKTIEVSVASVKPPQSTDPQFTNIKMIYIPGKDYSMGETEITR